MSQLPTQQPPIGASPDLNAQLQAIMQQLAAQRPAPGMAAPLPVAMFGAVQQRGVPAATAVLIPIKIPVGQGSVKVMLSFGPEYANPDAIMGLLNALGNAGVPVDVYVPKQQNGWSGGGGGYNGGGGGYGGGGGRRW